MRANNSEEQGNAVRRRTPAGRPEGRTAKASGRRAERLLWLGTAAGVGLLGALALRPCATGPSRIEAAAGMAAIYSMHGQHDRAVIGYRRLLNRVGPSPFVRLGLASALFRQGKLADAEREMRELLARDEDSPILLFNLAETLSAMGRAREARDLFARFAELYEESLPELGTAARAAMVGK